MSYADIRAKVKANAVAQDEEKYKKEFSGNTTVATAASTPASTTTPTAKTTTKKSTYTPSDEVIAERAQRARDTWVQEDSYGTSEDTTKRVKRYTSDKNTQKQVQIATPLLTQTRLQQNATKKTLEGSEPFLRASDDFDKYAESGRILYERQQQKKQNQQKESSFSTEAAENQSVPEITLNAMTNDERKMYYYKLAKDGQEAADNYMRNISGRVNTRLGQQEAAEIENMPSGLGKTLRYGFQSFMGGVDSATKGIAQALTDEVYDPSQTAVTSGVLGSNLTGLKKNIYEAGHSIGNMLPAVVATILTEGVGAPAVLTEAASGLMTGLGAGGNAYGEAIKDGYSYKQATTYGMLIGASEAALGNILGGVTELAGVGNVADKLLEKVAGIESGLARWALTQGVKIGAEINEEELQNFLEPLFRTVIFGEDYDAPTIQEIVDTAITTAISTGIMNFGQTTEYNPDAKKTAKYDADATPTDKAMMDTLAGRETAENPNVTQETDLDRLMQQTFAENKKAREVENTTEVKTDESPNVSTPRQFESDVDTRNVSGETTNQRTPTAESSVGAAEAGFDPYSHALNEYGAIEAGENPARVVDVPKSTDGKNKVSKFVRTAMEASITPDEMVTTLEQMVTDGTLTYQSLSNKQALEDAVNSIVHDYERGKTKEQIRSEFVRDALNERGGARFAARGIALYTDALAEGDQQAAAEIAIGLQAINATGGQTIQIARLLKKMTPEGRIFTAQRMISNLEAQINKTLPKKKQIELDVDNDLIQAYGDAKTEQAQQEAMGKIYDQIAPQVPTTLAEGLQQWRYFSMLFNPSTHLKNTGGNVGGMVAKTGKDVLATVSEEIFIGDVEKKKAKAASKVSEKYGLSEDFARSVAEVAYGGELGENSNQVLRRLASSAEARAAISDMYGVEISDNAGAAYEAIKGIWKDRQAYQAKHGRTKAFLNLTSEADRQLLELAAGDYEYAADTYDTGSKYGKVMNEINSRRRIWKLNDPKTKFGEGVDTVLKGMEAVSNFNSKALEVEDMWFSKPQYTAALAGYMKANHLTEITDAARKYAMTEAKRGTFNDLNVISEAATKLGGNSKLGKLIASIPYPFKKVPANVMVRTVEYSPLGLIKGGYELTQLGKESSDVTAAQVIDTFSASASGTVLLGVGYMLAKNGLLRATGVGDEKEKEQQKNAFGAKDFSFITSIGKYIPIDSFTLAGTGLLTGAQIYESIQNMKNGDEIDFASILDALSKITDPVFEQSMLTGVSDIIRTIQYSGTDTDLGELGVKIGIQMVGNYLGQYIPTVVKRIASSLDTNQRSTYVEPDGAWAPIQTAAQTLQKGIPWARENLMPTRGNWGVEIEGNGANGVLSAIGNAITPIYTSEAKSDPVEEEIARLHKVNSEYSNFYEKPKKYFSVDGETVKLTSEQYDKYVVADGQTDYNVRTALLDDNVYKNVPDSVKSKAMELSAEYANEIGKVAAGVGYEINEKWVQDLEGKSDEEIANAILKKAAIAVGGVAKSSEIPKFDETEIVGMDSAVVDKVMEQANTYADWVALENMGYDVSDAPEWVSEVKRAKEKQEKILAEGKELEAGTVTWKDMLVSRAVESAAKASGTDKYDGLSNMLEGGDISDATALLVIPSETRTKYETTSADHISVSQLVEVTGFKNAAKDEDGNFSHDLFIQSINDTDWTTEEKAYAYLTQYKEITDMPTEWYEGLSKDILTDYTRLAKSATTSTSEEAAERYKKSGATSYLDATKFAESANKSKEIKPDYDENDEPIEGSKAQKFVSWLSTTGWSAQEKATAYAVNFKTSNMPEGYYDSLPDTMVDDLLPADKAEKWDSTKADAGKLKIGLKYYNTLESDKDKNGNTITNSKMKKFRKAISEQNWTSAEKRAVFCTFYSTKYSWW